MDYHSGKVLVEQNAHQPQNPASLTKLMTSYVVGQEIEQGHIALADKVQVSNNAWARNFPDSSKMFIEVGTSVSVEDLYRGMVIQSGNDASVALAEHVAGSESGFVRLMNSWALRLGMKNSSFANAHGLDADGLYSTPFDIALLSQAIIRDLPDIYPFYSERSFTYNGITQHNRNGLLRHSGLVVDGMKTGYTSGAGYSLASSAIDGDMRLIAVVMGTDSAQSRESNSAQLFRYGFRFFDTIKPHVKTEKVISQRVYQGKENTVAVGVADDIYITLTHAEKEALHAEVDLYQGVSAPVNVGDTMGTLRYSVGDKELLAVPLVAQEAVAKGGLFKRLLDWFKLQYLSFFS